VSSTVQIVNKLKNIRYIFMDNSCTEHFSIRLRTQNHGAQFYVGSDVKYSLNAPIFKKINIVEQYYIEMLPVYI